MKTARALLAIAGLVALSLAASVPAQARSGGHGGYSGGHGGHSGGHGGYYGGGHGGHYHGYSGSYGFYFGWPFYSSWYYPPYYYPSYPYYPQAVIPSSPPVYVERGDEQAAPQAQSWWYYCTESKTYYPYVKQCPGGWQKVAPQPPAQ